METAAGCVTHRVRTGFENSPFLSVSIGVHPWLNCRFQVERGWEQGALAADFSVWNFGRGGER